MTHRAEGTRELAIEWMCSAIRKEIDNAAHEQWLCWGYGPSSDWVTCDDVGDWANDLVGQLPKYVEIIKLLQKNTLRAACKAVEMAKELK